MNNYSAMLQNVVYYFGRPWEAEILDGAEPIETPVEQKCYQCDEEIIDGDRGFLRAVHRVSGAKIEPVHRECDFRAVAGSLGHQLQMCSCYGGTFEDPQELTRREAAIVLWRVTHGMSALWRTER
jgi:hypothetical protein